MTPLVGHGNTSLGLPYIPGNFDNNCFRLSVVRYRHLNGI